MDSFTKKILERARERQKIISDKPIEIKKKQKEEDKSKILSSPIAPQKKQEEQDNTEELSDKFNDNVNSSEDLQNNIDVEIKVRSSENIRIEVEVKDDDDGQQHTPKIKKSINPVISEYGKGKLQRLAKLYTDGDISSPIHKTEGVFHAEPLTPNYTEAAPRKDRKPSKDKQRKGIGKLAELAENISNWEDDIKPTHNEVKDKVVPKRPWKQPAPQPPSIASPTRPKVQQKPANVAAERVKWDSNMINKLESQGFTRTNSNSKLIYNFKEQAKSNDKMEPSLDKVESKEKDNKSSPEEGSKPILKPTQSNNVANKVQMFEKSPTKAIKDPALLSVGERKALFEKNVGVALIPKAPFGMPLPAQNKSKTNHQQQVAVNNDKIEKESPLTKTVTATIENPPRVTKLVNKSGIAGKVAALLEAKKATISQEQITSNSKRELLKDMDLLLNRHNKNKKIEDEIQHEYTSDNEDADETTQMINNKQEIKVVPAKSPSPIRKEKRKSTDKPRISDSPQVTAVLEDVKRIKVTQPKEGRLYPCLSDIETATETEQEQDANSSSENSYCESYDGNSSFGNRSDRTELSSKRASTAESSADSSLLLSDMEEYMNIPLPNIIGPPPPKQGRISKPCNLTEQSNSFNYKSFATNNTEFKSPMKMLSPRKSEVPILVEDGENVLPLTHTVSFYRKQQNQVNTPIRQIIRQPIIEEDKENDTKDDRNEIEAKIDELNGEVNKQQLIIAQTSQALNLCNATIEFTGSTEQVEAERVLLLALHRRQALLHEIHRLQVEKTLKPNKSNTDKGRLTISNICLPMKKEYVRALAAAGGKGHHIVCLVKCNEQVYATQVVATVATSPKNPDINIYIPGSIVLNDVCGDFTIKFDVYCMQAQEEYLPHEVKYHINKKASSKLTPKKGKQDNRLVIPPRESPGGPSVVKATTFALTGYIVFSLQGINRNQWTLNNVPPMSPLEGTIEMKVTCEIYVEHRGFLTMFEDVCGFGAWHRRWCLLKGSTLSYWKYPDDETKRTPIDSIDLKTCINKTVGPVKREVCARLHTILLEREREAEPTDKDTLTKICKGDKTIIRHLLSADTKEERFAWTNMLNKTLSIYL